MKIRATFINFAYDIDEVELVCAWDEFSIEGNFEGWKRARQIEIETYGPEVNKVVDVDLEVSDQAIFDLFHPKPIEVESVTEIDVR